MVSPGSRYGVKAGKLKIPTPAFRKLGLPGTLLTRQRGHALQWEAVRSGQVEKESERSVGQATARSWAWAEWASSFRQSLRPDRVNLPATWKSR